MSETNFTPGPWVLIEGQFDSEVEVTTDSRQENSKGKICGMDIYFDGSHGVEQPANAHLIAAAPEMYEMLERFLPYSTFDFDGNETLHGGDFNWNEDDDPMIDELKTLLAKARGEK